MRMFFSARFTKAALAAVCVLLLPGALPAAEFTADFTRRSGDEEGEKSKVYLKGKLRREEISEDGQLQSVMIVRADRGVIWNLIPDENMYIEMPIGAGLKGDFENTEDLEKSSAKTPLGRETVSGYDCEVNEYAHHNPSQGVITTWYSDKLEYPVRIRITLPGEDSLIMEYANIKPGEVPDSMFDIPAGYQKMAIPGMPGGMMPPGMPGGMMPPGMPPGMPQMPHVGQ